MWILLQNTTNAKDGFEILHVHSQLRSSEIKWVKSDSGRNSRWALCDRPWQIYGSSWNRSSCNSKMSLARGRQLFEIRTRRVNMPSHFDTFQLMRERESGRLQEIGFFSAGRRSIEFLWKLYTIVYNCQRSWRVWAIELWAHCILSVANLHTATKVAEKPNMELTDAFP